MTGSKSYTGIELFLKKKMGGIKVGGDGPSLSIIA
jgi:hypothetical protein